MEQQILIDPNDSAQIHYQQACEAFDAADWAGVVTHLRAVLEEDWRHTSSYINLSYALAQLGRVEEAIAELKHCANIAPHEAEVQRRLGKLQAQMGKNSEAVTAYLRCVALLPDDAEALYGIAWALGDMGELGAARSVLRRVIEIAPQMAKAHTLLGYYQMQANQYEDAAESYGNAARIDIHDAAACLSLGSVLYHAGRIEEARAAWRQAIERDNSQQVKRAKQYLRRYRK